MALFFLPFEFSFSCTFITFGVGLAFSGRAVRYIYLKKKTKRLIDNFERSFICRLDQEHRGQCHPSLEQLKCSHTIFSRLLDPKKQMDGGI